MKKCATCGKPASSNNNVLCHSCGGKLIEAESAICRNCGAPVSVGSDFCYNCTVKINAAATAVPPFHTVGPPTRGGFYKKRHRDKVLLVIVTVILVLSLMVATALGTALLLKDRNSKKDNSTVSERENPIVKDAAIDTNKKNYYEEEIIAEKALSAYDYDPDNDDWYRLRKSRWDSSSQVGAFKTYNKALEHFETYGPRGYNLYDKDFKVIKTGLSSGTQNKYSAPTANNNNASSSSVPLYDYDPDNSDWYRLRKSRWNSSSQVGAYKTVEKALYYADIYCPLGYTLYDKDFNVIR